MSLLSRAPAIAAAALALIPATATAAPPAEVVHASEGVVLADALDGVQVFTAAPQEAPYRLYRRVGGAVSLVPNAPAGIAELDLGRDAAGRVVATVCRWRARRCTWQAVDVLSGRVRHLRFGELPKGCHVQSAAQWRSRIAYAVICSTARRLEGVYVGRVGGRATRLFGRPPGLRLQGIPEVDLVGTRGVAIAYSGARKGFESDDDRADMHLFRAGGCRKRVKTASGRTPGGLSQGFEAHLSSAGLLWSPVVVGVGNLHLSTLDGCDLADDRVIEVDERHSAIAADGGFAWMAGGSEGAGLLRVPLP